MLITLGIVAAGGLLGVAGGFTWAALAPRALFQVSSPGVAYVVNPETTAFIVGDAWFSLVAACGGIILGVAGYLAGVRRHGPLPAAGVLAGGVLAAFAASFAGRNVGLAAFRHGLATGHPGDLLRQPVVLGAHGALAFWPLAAGATVGLIELIAALRSHRPSQARDDRAAPAPAGTGPFPVHYDPGTGPPAAGNGGPGGGGPKGGVSGGGVSGGNGRPAAGPGPAGHRDVPADRPPAGRPADQ